MAIPQLSHLNEEERVTIYHAHARVAYLIGGADDNFDEKEEAEANNIIEIRTNTGDPILFDFFKEIEPDFSNQLKELVKQYGSLQAAVRTEILVNELAKLNEILPKMDSIYARAWLHSLRTLGQRVAEASGGFFGFLEVSYEEQHLLGLEMITFNP